MGLELTVAAEGVRYVKERYECVRTDLRWLPRFWPFNDPDTYKNHWVEIGSGTLNGEVPIPPVQGYMFNRGNESYLLLTGGDGPTNVKNISIIALTVRDMLLKYGEDRIVSELIRRTR